MKRFGPRFAALATSMGLPCGVWAGAALAAWLAAAPALAGTVLEQSLASPTLGRDYRFTVYLPDGYADACLSYPVLYLLHGANGDEHDWLVKGKAESTLDALIAGGAVPPTVVVMPGHKQMWWVDANAEKSQTVLMTELLPEVERRFRTIADRSGRLVAGLSAGGLAAARLSFQYPDRFAAAGALSPAVYEPLPPSTSSAMKDPPFQKDGKFDPETWQSLSWRTLFDGYRAQPLVVPFYINSGDIDRFEIAYHAAVLFRDLHRHQPGKAVFRVVAGDHEWPVWASTLGDALKYLSGHVSGPVESPPTACPPKK
ncbi:alpha/beta hydrolase [Skermanella pratensis]|uniref:alpha/beta hydrolase n=1 Tax=Skermanella pratensis TaxID=2233999 RepID=UPI0013014B6D|nr:alpha/beta hydrolase-fold protein [Skermanella pratensis]